MGVNREVKKSFWVKLVGAPIAMFLFAYALVPLYDVLCEITGFNGTTGKIDQESNFVVDENRKVNVNFFAATMPGFPVQFYPKDVSMDVVPGKFYSTSYIAKNNSGKEIIGQAVPSVAPTDAAANFRKLECFCFNKQVFKPGEKVEMPIRFVIEPGMDKHIKDVSLSYNFFKLES
jgi:cytochrome c oxidase assembly protein subunit 11